MKEKVRAGFLATVALAGLAVGIGWAVSAALDLKQEKAREALLGELSIVEHDGPIFPFRDRLNLLPIIEAIADPNEGAGRRRSRTPVEVENAVWNLHDSALTHVTRSLNLTDSSTRLLRKNLRERNSAIATLYIDEARREFVQAQVIPGEVRYFSYRLSDAARSFSRVLSRRLCDVMILSYGLSSPSRQDSMPGQLLEVPCKIVLGEVLLPISESLESQGLLADYLEGREAVSERIRHAIVELATAEDDFDIALSETYRREILWGSSVAHLRLHVKARVKAGFDLREFFSYEVDVDARSLIVTLPEPRLLSVEVLPKIQSMEDGWFVDIDEDKINQALATGRIRAAEAAVSSGLLGNARSNASLLIVDMLSPLAYTPTTNLRIVVDFKPSRKDSLLETG